MIEEMAIIVDKIAKTLIEEFEKASDRNILQKLEPKPIRNNISHEEVTKKYTCIGVDSSTLSFSYGLKEIILFRGAEVIQKNGNTEYIPTKIKGSVFNIEKPEETIKTLLNIKKEEILDVGTPINDIQTAKFFCQSYWEYLSILKRINEGDGYKIILKDGLIGSSFSKESLTNKQIQILQKSCKDSTMVVGIAKNSKIMDYLRYNTDNSFWENFISWKGYVEIPDEIVKVVYGTYIPKIYIVKLAEYDMPLWNNIFAINYIGEGNIEELLDILTAFVKDSPIPGYPPTLYHAHRECVISGKTQNIFISMLRQAMYEKTKDYSKATAIEYDFHNQLPKTNGAEII